MFSYTLLVINYERKYKFINFKFKENGGFLGIHGNKKNGGMFFS